VFLSSLAVELRRRGHDICVVTALPNYPTGRVFNGYRGRFLVRETIDEIPVIRTWVRPAQSARLVPRLTSYLTFCLTSFAAWFWIGRPDVVFVDSPPLFLGLTARCMSWLKRCCWILNVSDLWPDAIAELDMIRPKFLLRMAEFLERYLYASSDMICAVTHGIKQILIERKGLPEYKVSLLPIGVDTDLFRPMPADRLFALQHGLQDKVIFLLAGTLGYAQGLSVVIEAADLLRDRADIVIVLLGDGPERSRLKAESERRGLTGVKFFDGAPLREMPRWWSITRAGLVTLKDQPINEGARPSRTFPALASGVPVVFAGRGEMAGMLTSAGAGIVIPPEDPRALADAVLHFADNPIEAGRMGQRGRQLCERELCWSAIVETWLNDVTKLQRKTRRPTLRTALNR